jgi:AcrR family transcriptional regulator
VPREGEQTRRRIIDAAYEVFYKAGFARASVDAVAEAAGVTKRTLYYHFDSKDALIAAVLDAQHELVLARIQRWAKRASDPARIVAILFEEFAAWAKRPGWQGSGFTRATMELADLPGHPARAAARRHKAAIEGWLAEQLAQTGKIRGSRDLARQVMLLIEGCHSLVLIHGDTSYTDSAALAARLLVRRYRMDRSANPPY